MSAFPNGADDDLDPATLQAILQAAAGDDADAAGAGAINSGDGDNGLGGGADDVFPDIHALFLHYSKLYFDDALGAVSVEWSSARMTLCGGTCEYRAREGSVRVKLSEPLLKVRAVTLCIVLVCV